MKSITINGSQRESVGKKATKALRNAGQVPCVLYGGDQTMHFSAPELAFSKLVYTPNAHTVVIALDNGETLDAVLQDIQFHPVTDRILHVDFYRLFEDKEIAMDIPVHIIGTSKGVLNGGVLRRNRRKLRVKALPKNLPDFLEADITPLKIGGKLYVTALEGEDYKLLHTDNTVVVQIKTARTAIVEDEDEDEDELEGADTAATTEGGDAPAGDAPAQE
ncbi:LSU ribosomal protein L25P [Formosa sp. Hel1_31_208]|uniref:50S ribosomal protein L25/general stress protein Ctc n=1 Tax=Formosa sp. Hel1_31_208 TaxID=1798225 RepID=UPI00087D9A23|nr:50S ribosomal protein L25/general stress protein Ctc [Formosa sp. Hel1_31_208]SDR68994.1 LSU ribosomal protein L25P [Formosa sp. Hel1_31_208]